MGFKEWLIKEVGTSTGDIAGFRRITLPMVRRRFAPGIATMFADDPPPKSKKIKKQPQVEESVKKLAKKFGVDPKGLKQGVDVESEHDGERGKDTDVVDSKEDKAKIATAHLREDPKYYKKLKKIEQ